MPVEDTRVYLGVKEEKGRLVVVIFSSTNYIIYSSIWKIYVSSDRITVL
jgi:hypothetical protein